MGVIYKCVHCGNGIVSDCVYEGDIEDFSRYFDKKIIELSDRCKCQKEKCNKVFNLDKFREDLIQLRGKHSISKFSKSLKIVESELKGYESGMLIPSSEDYAKICRYGEWDAKSYCTNEPGDSFPKLLFELIEPKKITKEAEKIKEKYRKLSVSTLIKLP